MIISASILCVASTAHPSEGSQQPRGVTLSHFKHDRWTQEDGAPSNIGAIAQTPNGYLWLGARDGLWRFDGATFERIDPPPGSTIVDAPVNSLHVDGRGKLWVGFGQGAGVAFYSGGKLHSTQFPKAPPVITSLTHASDGSIWAQWGGISSRLWRFANGNWRLMDTAAGLPPGYFMRLLATRHGDILLPVMAPNQSSAGIAYLPRGASRFRWVGGHFDYPDVAEDPRGRLWVTDRRGTSFLDVNHPRLTNVPTFPVTADVRLPDLVFDRRGGGWGATQASGIFRISSIDAPRSPTRGQVEWFGAADGLTSDISKQTFSDREGNIWVGTDGGLDRFRFTDVDLTARIPADPINGLALAATSAGTIYVSSQDKLFQVDQSGTVSIRMRNPKVEALCAARDGSVWLIQRQHILKVGPLTDEAILKPPTDSSLSCSEDGSSRLWIVDGERTAWWHDAQGWHKAATAETSTIGSGIASSQNGAAFSSGGSVLTLIAGNRLRRYDLAGLGLGAITNVNAASTGYFIALSRGLALLRAGQVKRLDGFRHPWAKGLRAVVETAEGVTWLYGSAGIVRVSTAALNQAFDHPDAAVPSRTFDFRDGLAGGPQRQGFVGTPAVLGFKGRVWFATSAGLASIDPASISRDLTPPPVLIRSLVAGDRSFRDPTGVILPPGTTSIRIGYSATGLSIPERLRFRYRLDGVDSDWVDPGSRRGTEYTNLGPGRYRFRVIAANEAGVWNKKGAALDFEIRPTFIQGIPFRVLCGVAALAVLWIVYRLRILAVAAQVRARMAERHDERERIARELHDTLLQSIHGLLLSFQHATEKIPKDLPARNQLERVLEGAEEVIAQGRDRVRALRPATASTDLEGLLHETVNTSPLGVARTTSIRVHGTPRPLSAAAADEISRIATEATTNIARHANATHVEITISYSPEALLIQFRDDGIGFPASVLRDGKREGHYGLVGIRERVRRLAGDVVFDNLPDGGSELSVIVPADSAFAREPSRLRIVWGSLQRLFAPASISRDTLAIID